MGRRAKDTPDWMFIACPSCGAGAGKTCVDLLRSYTRGKVGQTTWRRPEPHEARVQTGLDARVRS